MTNRIRKLDRLKMSNVCRELRCHLANTTKSCIKALYLYLYSASNPLLLISKWYFGFIVYLVVLPVGCTCNRGAAC